MSDKHLVTKPAAVFSAFTIVSRIFGLIRDITAAAIFGAGMFWDAFVVAFTFPNMLRSIFGEGALSSSFVPVFTKAMHEKGKDEAWKIANITVTLLSIVLIALSFVVVTAALILQHIIPFSEKTALILKLLSILFPYAVFICVMGLFMGILNSFHKLAIPALSPIVFNAVLIAGMLASSVLFKNNPYMQVILLAFFVLIGGLIEFVIHFPSLKSVGMRYRFIPDWNNPSVKRIMWLMGPMVLGLGIVQVNLVVDRILALWIGSGAVSKLYFGSHLMQLPLGIFGVALAVSNLSVMSKQAARKDIQGLKDTLAYSLRLIFFISLPAAAGLIVMRVPIIKIIFQRGSFTSDDTAACARVLLCYSFGLFAYLGLKVITQSFYAMQNTRTPVKVGASMVFLNLILNLLLMIPLKEAGLALATAVCAVINMSILLYLLTRKIGHIGLRSVLNSAIRSACSAVVMGIACWFLCKKFLFVFEGNLIAQAFRLGGVIFAGLIVYIVCGFLFGSKEPRELVINLKSKT